MNQDTDTIGPVLIVDDNPDNLQLAAKIVHGAGYEVILAQDGQNALEMCRSLTPSAILLDIMMPGMNGLEVCKHLKEQTHFALIPVLFLSAAGEEEMIEEGMEYGGVDFIAKPIRERTLLARLRVHIERSTLQKSLQEQVIIQNEQYRLLTESEKALQQAIQKLHLLSGITRHDILNKITALNAYITLLKEEVSTPDGIEYLNRTKDTVDIISDQIAFTRDYQEIGMHAPAWQNIGNAVSEATRTLSLKEISLSCSIPDMECYADPLFPRVLYNLIENSLRHGENISEIRISGNIQNDTYLLILEDDGGGIPIPNKENIFLRKCYKNTGFGLFLSRDILQITNFTIRETGEYGRGARFEITIPEGYYRTSPTS